MFHVRFKLAAARIERKRDGGVRNSKNRERRMRDQLEKGNKQLKNTSNDEAYLISRRCRKMAGNRHDKLLKLEEKRRSIDKYMSKLFGIGKGCFNLSCNGATFSSGKNCNGAHLHR